MRRLSSLGLLMIWKESSHDRWSTETEVLSRMPPGQATTCFFAHTPHFIWNLTMNEHLYLQISRYSQPSIIAIGTIGSLFNQILFHRRQSLRTASCAVYFRALSINDLLVLYIVVFTQWLTDQFQLDLTVDYQWFCKIRTYLMYCSYAISPYLIVLVCLDRLCRVSNYARLRRLTTPRRARQLILGCILLICLIYSHILWQYKLTQGICHPLSLVYFRFLGCFLLIFYCLLPPILMSITSSLTLVLLHRRQQRQKTKFKPIVLSSPKRHRNRDYQLMKVLVLYVTSNAICTLPFALIFLVTIFRANADSQLLLWIKTSVLLCNVNYCTSFYVYTLSMPFYRQEFFHLTGLRASIVRSV